MRRVPRVPREDRVPKPLEEVVVGLYPRKPREMPVPYEQKASRREHGLQVLELAGPEREVSKRERPVEYLADWQLELTAHVPAPDVGPRLLDAVLPVVEDEGTAMAPPEVVSRPV